MRQPEDKMMDRVPGELLYGLMALAGGISRYLYKYVRGEKFSLRMMVANVVISGFTGFMFALIGKNMGITVEMTGVFAGVGGWLGANGIEFLADVVKARTKV